MGTVLSHSKGKIVKHGHILGVKCHCVSVIEIASSSGIVGILQKKEGNICLYPIKRLEADQREVLYPKEEAKEEAGNG